MAASAVEGAAINAGDPHDGTPRCRAGWREARMGVRSIEPARASSCAWAARAESGWYSRTSRIHRTTVVRSCSGSLVRHGFDLVELAALDHRRSNTRRTAAQVTSRPRSAPAQTVRKLGLRR